MGLRYPPFHDDKNDVWDEDDDEDVDVRKMAPKTKYYPSIVRDTTLFLRDLSRTTNEIVQDKVRPVVDNAAYRRRNSASQQYRGMIPGNLEWPKVLLEFVAEDQLRGFCIDAVFQVLTAPCDHPCPSEITSTMAHLTVKSFLDNQSLVQECKIQSRYPVQEVSKNIEDVTHPYDALSVMQRLMTHLTQLASTWLREGVTSERCVLAGVLKAQEANHDYNSAVLPVVDAARIGEQDSDFEDSDSDEEKLNSGNSPETSPLRNDLLPLPPKEIQNTNYQGFVHAIKNTRRKMEDRHVIIPDLNKAFNVDIPGSGSLFGVFDGHGGMEASAFAAAQLPLAFADFLQTAEEKDPVAAFNHAFHEVDYHFAAKSKSESLKSGSTGVACFLSEDSLYLSWLGDSQALLLRGVSGLNANPLPVPGNNGASKNGASQNGATQISVAGNGGSENGAKSENDDADSTNSGDSTSNGHHDDASASLPPHYPQPFEIMLPHRPDREDEKRRIEALGGIVIWFGTWRVNGSIAVSRSIGDVDHKPFVSADSDSRKIELGSDDDLLILGCDGLFDTLDSKTIAKCVYEHLNPAEGGSIANLPHKLVKEAKSQGSSDNITALVVPLIHHKKREWGSQKDVTLVIEEFSNLSTDSDHEEGETNEPDI